MQVHICGYEWNASTAIEQIAMKFGIRIHAPLSKKSHLNNSSSATIRSKSHFAQYYGFILSTCLTNGIPLIQNPSLVQVYK